MARSDQEFSELRTDFVRTTNLEPAHVEAFDKSVGWKRHDADADEQFRFSPAAV